MKITPVMSLNRRSYEHVPVFRLTKFNSVVNCFFSGLIEGCAVLKLRKSFGESGC